MLHVTITVAPAFGPSPLRGHIAATRESVELVDLAVVLVRAADTDRSGGARGGNGSGGHASGRSGPANDPGLGAVAVPAAAELESLIPGGVGALLASYEAVGAAGEMTQAIADLGNGPVRLMFLGIGDGSAGALRRAGAVLGRRAAGRRMTLVSLPADLSPDAVQAFAEGVLLGSYRYAFASDGGSGDALETDVPAGSGARHGPEAPDGPGTPAWVPNGPETPAEPGPDAGPGAPQPERPSGAVLLLATEPADAAAFSAAAARAAAVGGAVALARDLVNTPSARKSPQWLADQATELAQRRGLGVRVRTGEELAADGFGGIVAVGSGSSRPPRLIELAYRRPGGTPTSCSSARASPLTAEGCP